MSIIESQQELTQLIVVHNRQREQDFTNKANSLILMTICREDNSKRRLQKIRSFSHVQSEKLCEQKSTIYWQIKLDAQQAHCEHLEHSLAKTIKKKKSQEHRITTLRTQKSQRLIKYEVLQKKHTSLFESYHIIFEQLFRVKENFWIMTRVRSHKKDEEKTFVEIKMSSNSTHTMTIRNDRNHVQDEITFKDRIFELNHVFDHFFFNAFVFEIINLTIAIALNDQNVCVIVDEQSNIDKIYIMFNDLHVVVISIITQIFFEMTTLKDREWTCCVICSILKNYFEKLRNLLFKNSQSYQSKIEVKVTQRKILVKSFTHRFVDSIEELLSLLKLTCENRRNRRTHKNNVSSREHLVCTLKLSRALSKAKTLVFKLCLIDFANSERWNFNFEKIIYNQETRFINANRSELRQIIKDYETSKLTFATIKMIKICWMNVLITNYVNNEQLTKLLYECFISNFKIVFIVHLSSYLTNEKMTLQILIFAKEMSNKSSITKSSF